MLLDNDAKAISFSHEVRMVNQEWLEVEINRDIFVLDGRNIQDAQRSLEVWERMGNTRPSTVS